MEDHEEVVYKIVALGKDCLLHCCDVNNKEVSSCEDHVTIRLVNPDFNKIPNDIDNIFWCYECSDLLEKQEKTL